LIAEPIQPKQNTHMTGPNIGISGVGMMSVSGYSVGNNQQQQ